LSGHCRNWTLIDVLILNTGAITLKGYINVVDPWSFVELLGSLLRNAHFTAALILPICNTFGMYLRLQEISETVSPGAHAIVIVDQAGWHFSKAFEIPDNITLSPLLARSPELKLVDNVWQFMRDNWLSN
jgi:hypothetical protein